MTVDHASEMFNSGRFVTDAAFLYEPGTSLPVVQFLVRYLLLLAAWSLGVSHQRGLPETFIATAGVIGLLYPCCRWYRGYETTHPNGWARYV
jgi:hypothetical protein